MLHSDEKSFPQLIDQGVNFHKERMSTDRDVFELKSWGAYRTFTACSMIPLPELTTTPQAPHLVTRQTGFL